MKRGQALAKKLKRLNLYEEEDSEENDDSGFTKPTRSKSPFKSQKNMTSGKTVTEPYNLPSASGPGGLVAMLTSLKRIRRERLKKEEAEKEEEMEECPPEKSVYFDANSTFPLDETFTTTASALKIKNDNNNR